MNRYIILLLSGLLAITEASGQNRRISFEDITLRQALEKAAAGNRLIFADCYTEWCGPCKLLEKDIFTRDSVADYFNSNFINIRVDMEKGEGPAMAVRYGVKAYPTLLFIASDGRAVHTAVGYMEPARLIEQAKLAASPSSNTAGIIERFERGDRDPEFLREYIRTMSDANMKEQAGLAAIEYLTPLMTDFDQFTKPGNWDIIEMALIDPYSDVFTLVMEYRPYFEETVGKSRVDEKIGAVLEGPVYEVVGFPGEFKEYDQAEYEKLVAFLMETNDYRTPALLAHLYLCDAARRKEYAEMTEVLDDALRYNIFYVYGSVYAVQSYIDELGKSERPEQQRRIVAFLDKILPMTPYPHMRVPILKLMARMHGALGNKAEAEKASQQAKQAEVEAQESLAGEI